jgi:hypothetical protein
MKKIAITLSLMMVLGVAWAQESTTPNLQTLADANRAGIEKYMKETGLQLEEVKAFHVPLKIKGLEPPAVHVIVLKPLHMSFCAMLNGNTIQRIMEVKSTEKGVIFRIIYKILKQDRSTATFAFDFEVVKDRDSYSQTVRFNPELSDRFPWKCLGICLKDVAISVGLACWSQCQFDLECWKGCLVDQGLTIENALAIAQCALGCFNN